MPRGFKKDTKPACLDEMIRRKEGRPPVKIDWNQVNELLELGCTAFETAASIGVSYDALLDRCKAEFGCILSELIQKQHQKRNANIRIAQQKKALSNDSTMLIWLGKQYMEQADKIEQKTELKIDQPLFMPQKAPTQ